VATFAVSNVEARFGLEFVGAGIHPGVETVRANS
jgi:hypothetical protein